MDIRSFFGGGDVKTKKKSVPPPHLRGQKDGRGGGGSGTGAGKSKGSSKKAGAGGGKTKEQEERETAGRKKKKIIVVDSASETEDETPVPSPGPKVGAARDLPVPRAGGGEDSDATDDGGVQEIVRVVTTPDRRRIREEEAGDDERGEAPSSTSKNDWERALNFNPGSGKRDEEGKAAGGGGTKRKTPEGRGGREMGRPRKIEMAASDYFGGAAIAKGDKNLRSKAAEDNCSPRDGEDEGGRGDGGSRPAARADRGPCSPRKKKRASRTVDDDDDDGDFEPTRSDDDSEDDFLPSAAKEVKKKPPTPAKKMKREKDGGERSAATANAKTEATPKKRSPTKKTTTSSSRKQKTGAPVKPTERVESYPSDLVASPQLLDGLTFVFTGVLSNLHREAGEDYVKILGGRVTTAVSGRTDYLVCGDVLEDGRDVTEGSKYRKATELGEEKVVLLRGEGELYGLVKLLDGRVGGRQPKGGSSAPTAAASSATSAPAAKPNAQGANNPYTKPVNPYAAPSNPYANPYTKKAAVPNPYATGAATANPYAKPNPYAKAASSSSASSIPSASPDSASSDPNALWADKYAPKSSHEILGNADSVKKLQRWLSTWESTFNKGKSRGKTMGKAALLSGPPGIGKTTTANLIAMEAGRHVLELNASDTRSKKSLTENLGDVTGSHVISFAPRPKGGKGEKKKRCIIMDEVDGMGAGDRSGMAELIKMIKSSQVPIICICNDRQSPKVKSLAGYCLDLRYRRPVKTTIARRAVEVGRMENMVVELNAAEAIAESCGNDVRQVLNCLQMWSKKKRDGPGATSNMTYKDLKDRQNSINKDEILRVSLFDATKKLIQGPTGLSDADEKTRRDSLFSRSDAFFSDYSLMGLMVHQNYPKVMVSQFQETRRSGDTASELSVLERMFKATQSMSDYSLAEHAVRSGDQNWGLLPLCSMMCVQTGHHAGGPNGGFFPSFPEFAGWLGKNSSRNKKMRLLQELGHHMNYRVSADTTELRIGYVPALRECFLDLMLHKDGPKADEVITVMDEYGLDRDDLFEKLEEITLDRKARKFANLDSKTKAAFTREYNKRSHKSQALVMEQGGGKAKKSSAGVKAVVDPDAIDEDISSEPEEDEDEMDAEAIKKLFKRAKKRKSNDGKGKGSKNKKK